MPYPGQKLSDIEKSLRQTLAEFEQRGVTDEDIQKFTSSQEANMIYGLESVSGKVRQLAAYYTYTGDANYINKDLKRYTTVTKEDVMRVYKKYIKDKHAVIVSVMTKTDDQNKVAEDNYAVREDGYRAPDYGYSDLKYTKAKDNFDRSK